MTFENNPPQEEEKQPVYDSTMQGLRSAAEEVAPPESETVEVTASEDAGTDLTVKEASKELSKYQQRVAVEQEAVRTAMGVDVPDPSETERLEARVRELESSRQSVDVDAHLREGQQQLQAAHQAQHQVEQYRNQLIENFRGAYPEINSIEDIQQVASYDPDRAAMAVRDLQQCEQALATQQQAVIGQQSIAHQALAVWGASEDQKVYERTSRARQKSSRPSEGWRGGTGGPAGSRALRRPNRAWLELGPASICAGATRLAHGSQGPHGREGCQGGNPEATQSRSAWCWRHDGSPRPESGL